MGHFEYNEYAWTEENYNAICDILRFESDEITTDIVDYNSFKDQSNTLPEMCYKHRHTGTMMIAVSTSWSGVFHAKDLLERGYVYLKAYPLPFCEVDFVPSRETLERAVNRVLQMRQGAGISRARRIFKNCFWPSENLKIEEDNYLKLHESITFQLPIKQL